MIFALAFIDSTLVPVERPVDIYVDSTNRIYVLSLNGRLYMYSNLRDTPVVIMDSLMQPSLEMEFLGDTLLVMHGRFLQAFFDDTNRILIDFLPITSEYNTFDVDTVRRLIYVAMGGRWGILYGGRILRVSFDGRDIYTMAMGLEYPICMDVDSRGIPWLISRLDGDMYGLYPIYEGMDYSNLVPSIYFRDEPADIISLGRGFLVAFRNGRTIYFRRIRRGMYERDSLGMYPIEISSIFLKSDTLYMSDYSSGRIYMDRLEVEEWRRSRR